MTDQTPEQALIEKLAKGITIHEKLSIECLCHLGWGYKADSTDDNIWGDVIRLRLAKIDPEHPYAVIPTSLGYAVRRALLADEEKQG